MTETRKCARCGEPFQASTRGNGKNRIYCSGNCRRRHSEARLPPPRCVKCGSPREKSAETCWDCYRASVAAAHRERMDAQLWNEGATTEEIKRYMGYSERSSPPILSEMMRLGIIQARRYGVRKKHAAR